MTNLLDSPLPGPAPVPTAGAAGARSTPATSSSGSIVPEPFLHVGKDDFYNPLTALHLASDRPEFALLTRLREGLDPLGAPREQLATLEREGWMVPVETEHGTHFRLRYVSLESHTVCNQACYFCPVSIAPRDAYFMPLDFFESIAAQLSAYRSTIEGVSTINYNEPTIDKRLVEQMGILHKYGLPPAIVTNATGLTPKKVDALIDQGGISYLSVNFSTMDAARYKHDRKGDHAALVLANLDYIKDRPLAKHMEIAVLGRGDDIHESDFEQISERYGGSRFEIKRYEVMDRAGSMGHGHSVAEPIRKLCGCEQSGSRPLEWLHVNPKGECLLCCQDYSETHIAGDLRQESLEEVLTGPKFAQLRRWVYGIDEAPDDFICRNCVYALSRD